LHRKRYSAPVSSLPHLLHSFPPRRSSDLSAGTVTSLRNGAMLGGSAAVESWYTRSQRPRRRPRSAASDEARPRQSHQRDRQAWQERKSTRLNSSHVATPYAVFGLKKKKHL